MKTVKILLSLAVVASMAASCKRGCTDPNALNYDPKAKKESKKSDEQCKYADPVVETEKTVSGSITENSTWTKDLIWILDGKVVVKDGITLTIEPGTIVKAKEGSDVNASALIVERGAKINAAGTSTSPIIFTSVLDDIQTGQTSGTNLSQSDKGLWGGLIILGKAPVSTANGDTEGQIEGIPATETYGTYGGSSSADNSGVLTYVSIRHGGALIGEGNEINGLTLGGVGSGTTINHIEVVGNVDDGVELFGGTVNVSNIVVSYQGDDAIDIDQNYSGTIDNFIVVHGTTDTDEALEIDGPEGSTYKTGLFTLKNGTIISSDGAGSAGDFKSKAQGTTENVKFSGYTGGAKIKVAQKYGTDCTTVSEDAWKHLVTDNTLVFTTCEFAGGVKVYTTSTDASSNACAVVAQDQTDAEGKMSSTTATGADTTPFSWTWSKSKGLF